MRRSSACTFPQRLGLKLPDAAAEDGDAGAAALDAGDVHVVAADHEVEVTAAVYARAVALADQRRIAAAERDVADRVLVEQRVEKRRSQLTDAALPRRRARLRRVRCCPQSSAARAPRMISSPSSAVISTALPPSNRTTSPRTMGPSPSASG